MEQLALIIIVTMFSIMIHQYAQERELVLSQIIVLVKMDTLEKIAKPITVMEC